MKSKKFKWAIPAAVLALSCGTMVALGGCDKGNTGGGDDNPPAHTHEYTEWVNTDPDEHWKICPEDGTVDETTREEHDFDDEGNCECGAKGKAAVYGSVKGEVKLIKYGAEVTDFTGLKVDFGDDDVEIDVNKTAGTFTATNVKVDKTYTVKISKTGYKEKSMDIMLMTENQELQLVGDKKITLEYEVFTYFWGYDTDLHDLSNVNVAENPTVGVNGDGNKTLNVISTEKFGDVSVTLHAKSANAGLIQGILMQFSDGKVVMFNLKTDQSLVQYRPKEFGKLSIFNPNDKDVWVESPAGSVTDADKAKFNGEGVDVTLTRKGGKLYAFVDGRFVLATDLPEDYVEDQAQVGLFAFGVKANAVWSYNITDQVPAEMTSTLAVNITQPEDAGCGITIGDGTSENKTFALGETVELTIQKATGYKLKSLTVGGVDMFNAVENDRVTITANKLGTLEINAEFEQEVPIALNLTVNGKKLGKTEALAENTQVTFSGITTPFTVDADGKIKGASVIKGRYTVSVDGYFSKDIVFDENLTEIVFEYDAFTAGSHVGSDWSGNYGNPSNIDKSHVNDEDSYFIINDNANDFYQYTKTTYTDVSASVTYVQGLANKPGIGLVFDGNKAVMIRIEKPDNGGKTKAQWLGGGNWEESAINGDWDFGEGEENYNPLSDALMTKYAADGLELKLVKVGLKVYAFVDGNLAGEQTLPAEYADKTCRVVFFAGGVSGGGKQVHFGISESDTRPAVTITDGTDTAATGSIAVTQNVKVGDTVTITVTPDDGKILDVLTVSGGITPTAGENNTYTFVATETAYTVTATFKDAPANEAVAAVSGIGLGNTAVDMKGKTVTFTPASGSATILTVKDDGNVQGVLSEGTYTASCEGFYDLTGITVDATGDFTGLTDGLKFEKKIFVTNFINEVNLGEKQADAAKAASTGKITATEAGKMYEWTADLYDDVAFTVTLKSGNGNQGILMCFGNENDNVQVFKEHAVRVRFENSKAQWWGGDWNWGTLALNGKWDFMDGGGENYAVNMSSALLAKYNGEEGLKLTLVRKGAIVYALIDGEVYDAQIVSDCATNKTRLALFAENATAAYEIPFDITTDVVAIDKMLDDAKDTHGVLSVLGKYTVTDTTLAVTGNGYAEFAPTETATKESLKVKIADINSDAGKNAQGVLYRFANGKWIAARIESCTNDQGAREAYIQYADDTMIPHSGGSLTGWGLVHNLTDAEKAAFDDTADGAGIDLQLVRNGKYIYVLLGENVIDMKVLGDEYATMDGVMAATMEKGTGKAYAYEYKSGDDVTVHKDSYAVTAAFNGASNGYAIRIDNTTVSKDGTGTAKVEIYADPDTLGWSSWGKAPTSVLVNGVEKITDCVKTSQGSNKATWTLDLDSITADTAIVVTIGDAEQVDLTANVAVADTGVVVPDSTAYYWNDGCDLYMNAAEGYELSQIKITFGTGESAEVVTIDASSEAKWSEGTFEHNNVNYKYKYSFNVKASATIEVTYSQVAA